MGENHNVVFGQPQDDIFNQPEEVSFKNRFFILGPILDQQGRPGRSWPSPIKRVKWSERIFFRFR